MNDIEIQNIKFFNLWAKFYDYGPVSWWLQWMQKKALNQAAVNPKAKIIDIGCGTGKGLELLKQKGFTKLYGADISPEMLKKANQRLKQTAVLKQASVEKLPFKNNTFDIATNTEAFHHFPNPEKAIKEIHRALKQGGLFYLADINFYSKTIHWLFKKLEPGHVKIYSKKEFTQLFKQAGFEIIEQKRISLFAILTVGKKKLI